VRESTTPALFAIPERASLADYVTRNAAEAPQTPLFSVKVDGGWEDVTAARFRDEVVAVAKGLVASGVGVGDRVGIFAQTRYEWTLLDFAAWTAGAVPVPIYATSSAEQVQWILGDSGAVACVVENAEFQARVDGVRADLPQLAHVWQIEQDAVARLVRAGQDVPDAELAARREAVTAASVATIIYTSGTTGRPKGCVLTHGNFMAECESSVAANPPIFTTGPDGLQPATLLFLPLAHVFGRAAQVCCMLARVRLAYAGDVKTLAEDLATSRPTFIMSVPYVLEKLYNKARQKAHAEGKGRIFETAVDTAIGYSTALDTGRPSLALRAKHGAFDRLVYTKFRAALGGRVRFVVSGGAALGERLGHFFRGTGMTVLEGYGLTETTAAATANAHDRVRIGTVGRPMPGLSVRIADDGEVLLRGGQVFGSYWNNEQATADAFTDGWFLTGDLGELDDDGYLRITGRKKELLVTSGGKNVAPAVIEDRIRAHPLVSQCMVVGDGRAFVSALVTIDPETLEAWKAEHNKSAGATVPDLVDDPDLVAAVQGAVDEANQAVSRAESVRKFRILGTDFTVEDGHLTPSLKLKRHVAIKEFATEIEELYKP
jgi:long-chain acyl-CoA synthetase